MRIHAASTFGVAEGLGYFEVLAGRRIMKRHECRAPLVSTLTLYSAALFDDLLFMADEILAGLGTLSVWEEPVVPEQLTARVAWVGTEVATGGPIAALLR